MIKLYVVFVGLLAIWWDPSTQSGEVLMRKATGEYVGDTFVPKHKAVVEYKHNGQMVSEVFTQELMLEFMSSVSQNNFSVVSKTNNDSENQLLPLKDLVKMDTNEVVNVADSCLPPNGPKEPCAKYLSGWIKLSAGLLSPIHVYWQGDKLWANDEVFYNVGGRYRPAAKTRQSDFKMNGVANGALLAVDLAGAGVSMHLNDTEVEVEEASQADLDRIGVTKGANDTAYVVWVENLPTHHQDPVKFPVDDIHFSLLYDFLDKQDVHRWVPVVGYVEDKLPPGSQCIMPLMVK